MSFMKQNSFYKNTIRIAQREYDYKIRNWKILFSKDMKRLPKYKMKTKVIMMLATVYMKVRILKFLSIQVKNK